MATVSSRREPMKFVSLSGTSPKNLTTRWLKPKCIETRLVAEKAGDGSATSHEAYKTAARDLSGITESQIVDAIRGYRAAKKRLPEITIDASRRSRLPWDFSSMTIFRRLATSDET
jgi:hypothetical protein